jgi:hypothetical protein
VNDLREVRLLGFPLALHARSVEHHEELMREFQLLALATHAADVPQRLVTLVDELTSSFAGFTDAPAAERDAALDRGEDAIDLTYAVPPTAGDAALRLDRMLEEADEYCRAGDRLLTMAAPADAAALRHWQLTEFAAQLDGAEPTPWAEWLTRHPLPAGA